MRRRNLALVAMICFGVGGSANAQQSVVQNAGFQNDGSPQEVAAVGWLDAGQADCGCESACDCPVEPTCGLEYGGCDGAGESFGGIFADGGCSDCDLGDPWVLFGEACGFSMGGWVQLGYHSKALPLFNSRPDEVQLHQTWLYAEKAIDTSGGFDIGGRIDYVYGTDGPDTQAFGIGNGHWDSDWTNGTDYGHAIPQLYLEAGYGDWSVKAGHFYTIIGWEVVTAPDNFFYSHAYTMYNSEPFTHTGALATYSGMERLELFGGYVLGWDSGFEDNGDAFLGGASLSVSDDVTVTYATTGGVFANNQAGIEKGYMHSIVGEIALTDQLQYIIQSDVLSTENSAGQTVRDTFGINQYLIRQINDCISVGARFEWWQVQADSQGFYNTADPLPPLPPGFDPTNEDFDFYALTLGVNVRPHANVLIRPEMRWDWVYGGTNLLQQVQAPGLENYDSKQTTFGIDAIFTF